MKPAQVVSVAPNHRQPLPDSPPRFGTYRGAAYVRPIGHRLLRIISQPDPFPAAMRLIVEGLAPSGLVGDGTVGVRVSARARRKPGPRGQPLGTASRSMGVVWFSTLLHLRTGNGRLNTFAVKVMIHELLHLSSRSADFYERHLTEPTVSLLAAHLTEALLRDLPLRKRPSVGDTDGYPMSAAAFAYGWALRKDRPYWPQVARLVISSAARQMLARDVARRLGPGSVFRRVSYEPVRGGVYPTPSKRSHQVTVGARTHTIPGRQTEPSEILLALIALLHQRRRTQVVHIPARDSRILDAAEQAVLARVHPRARVEQFTWDRGALFMALLKVR